MDDDPKGLGEGTAAPLTAELAQLTPAVAHAQPDHRWDERFVRPPTASTASSPIALLEGTDEPLPFRGPFAVVEGLLKLPANVMYEVRTGRSMTWKLTVLVMLSMAITGLCLAAFSGGLQLFAVPLKLSLGMTFCALICLPSLHIFAALSGGRLAVRETWGALLLGVGLTSVLLVGFAPVSWVFSQATDSSALVGALHLFFFLISAIFGLRLTRRALVARAGRPVPALALWSMIFVLVVVQMSTTLRPLAGPFEGFALAPKQSFLEHWFS